MFEACGMTYESAILDRQGFEPCDEPVWILGRKYDTTTNMEELLIDVKSRLWFTYRRSFLPIGQSGMTSDRGWGCMLRCGQMVLAQALVNHHLGRDCQISSEGCEDNLRTYQRIMQLFQDKKTSTYSIHQMAQMGVSEGKEIGQWFGPNTVAQVLKKLSVYDEWSSLKIHIALDNMIITEEIEQLCGNEATDVQCLWNPLLLVIPLRLGLQNINPIYVEGLKLCLQMPQSVGMIGGKPSQALYFIGYTGDDVVFLDPHVTQQTVDLDELVDGRFDDSSYHPETCSRMNFLVMDPSLAVCFACTTRSEWQDLVQRLQQMIDIDRKQSLFEICTQRQPEWCPTSDSNIELFDQAIALESGESEEEFEILG